MEMKEKKIRPRFHLIDESRGFWFINMIMYHAIWDLVYIFGYEWQWYQSGVAFVWQQCICWSLIFISGFCWQMSRKNLKRGLQVFGAGLVITLATVLFMPDSRVLFGVLTLIGSSMLLMIPCDKVLRNMHPWIGAVASFLIFLFVYPVNSGYFGFGGVEMLTLPRELYSSWIGSYLGFTEPGFWSTDYFSIVPWFFLYLVGYFSYGVVFKGKEGRGKALAKRVMEKSIFPPLGWVGRNALIIYMLHQPVIYGILMLWNSVK